MTSTPSKATAGPLQYYFDRANARWGAFVITHYDRNNMKWVPVGKTVYDTVHEAVAASQKYDARHGVLSSFVDVAPAAISRATGEA